ncbi:MAG: hypothetical protein K6E55_01885, partial [Thermoguttaceae bacterium]|nr:hypothetical protein [Thermoguttaceae bacterium]
GGPRQERVELRGRRGVGQMRVRVDDQAWHFFSSRDFTISPVSNNRKNSAFPILPLFLFRRTFSRRIPFEPILTIRGIIPKPEEKFPKKVQAQIAPAQWIFRNR